MFVKKRLFVDIGITMLDLSFLEPTLSIGLIF